MMKWYSVELDPVQDSKLIRYFKEYFIEKRMQWESCGCYGNTLLQVLTDENGLCKLNNAVDDFLSAQGE